MIVQDYEQKVSEVRELLRANRPLWYRMDRAGIASYRYFVKLERGDVATPSVHKLAAIEQYLRDAEAA